MKRPHWLRYFQLSNEQITLIAFCFVVGLTLTGIFLGGILLGIGGWCVAMIDNLLRELDR